MQILGVSVDSPFSHLAWCQTGGLLFLPQQTVLSICHLSVQTAASVSLDQDVACHISLLMQRVFFVDRKEGGVGDLAYPLVSDLKREISSKYYVLTQDGVALRGLFIIDKEVSPVHLLTCFVLLHRAAPKGAAQ